VHKFDFYPRTFLPYKPLIGNALIFLGNGENFGISLAFLTDQTTHRSQDDVEDATAVVGFGGTPAAGGEERLYTSLDTYTQPFIGGIT
jgi:hypothetical protein